MKKGKRCYGAYYHFNDGRVCYLVYRRYKDIFRGGRKTISEALRTKEAAWAIDVDTLIEVSRRGVRVIGVLVKDTGELYLTFLADFYDHEKATVRNYRQRGGSLQRFLPLHHWRRYRAGRVKL